MLGGIASLISKFAITAYFIVQIISVINGNSTLRVTQNILNTAIDTTTYNITPKGFDIAFTPLYGNG